MSTGIFGTIRPANIDISEVEMYYNYRPTRSTEDEDMGPYFEELPAEECLVPSSANTDGGTVVLNGLYTLRLPLDYFGEKGFYTIYIKPQEIETTIVDVSVLAAYPDTKGVVLSLSNLNGISDLTGYRLDYEDGSSRLVTSCNYCEPVVVNMGDAYPKTTRYRLVDSSSNYVFCTVSPSSTPSFKPDSSPYIGQATETIKVCSTAFSPKMIEIEMVDHDFDTISTVLEGTTIRDRDNALVTVYTDDGEIYMQHDVYTLKDKLGNPLYDVKEKRDTIDSTQELDNILGNE